MVRSVFRAALAAFLAAALTGVAPTPVAAQALPTPAPLTAYGALPSLELVQVSPSGRRLAFVTVSGEQRVLVLLDLETRAQIGGVDVGQAKVRDLEWIGEERVLITTSKTETVPQLGLFNAELFSGQIYDPGANRIVAMLANSRGLFPALFSTPDVIDAAGGSQVLVRAFSFENPERTDLFSIDLATGRARLAEVMGVAVTDYILGADGESIARSEYEPRSQTWSLYLRQGGSFRKTWDTTAPIDQPNLMGLGLSGDSVVLAAERPDLSQPGREDAEFFDVNLASGDWRAVRFDFNPQALVFHPATHRLMGATRLDDDGRRYAFADPQARQLWETALRAFAGRSPELVSWSDDLKKAVVFTSGPRDSGSYHLLDLDAARVTPAGGAYSAITPDQVAPVRSITYAAGDGLQIHGFLTLPPGREDARGLPLVVLAHGGPASRDIVGFDWWGQALASRGYAVLQANFRGSTGYGDEFMEAGYGEWGRKMQTDLSDGVRYLAEQDLIDPRRVCIVGASYGGYAALAGVTVQQDIYRCAVSVAGISDLRRMVEEEASDGARRENVTVRYWNRFMGADRLGDRSLDERSPVKLAEQAGAPILLLHGRDDSVVPIDQSRIMANALRRAGKPVEFVELEGEDHWLSRGDTRQRMLTETVAFLQANNPAD